VLEVLSDDTGSGGEGGLEERSSGETLLNSVFGNKTSLEHDARVGGVSAGGDSSNHDGTVLEFVVNTFKGEFLGVSKFVFGDSETLEADLVGQAIFEVVLHAVDLNSVVRSFGASDARHNGGEVELHDVTGVGGVNLGTVVNTEETLGLKVGLDDLDSVGIGSDELKVLDGLVIDGEEAHGGTVLGGHVSDSGSVGEVKVSATFAEEFDELSNDTSLTEHVGAGEHQIGGGGVGREVTGESEADDLGEDHGDLLAEHDRLGFDASDTPSDDTKSVDHSGVRVSADKRIGVKNAIFFEDNASKPFQVDLMDNTIARGHNSEVVEGLLTPLEESEALLVTLELKLFVLLFGVGGTGDIDLDGVIDDQVSLAKRVNFVGVSTEFLHGSSHGGEIDNSGHTGEILEEDTGGLERDLDTLLRGHGPVEDGLDISGLDVEVVAVADGTLEEDSDRVGELGESLVLQVEQVVVGVLGTVNLDLLVEVGKWVSGLHFDKNVLLR